MAVLPYTPEPISKGTFNNNPTKNEKINADTVVFCKSRNAKQQSKKKRRRKNKRIFKKEIRKRDKIAGESIREMQSEHRNQRNKQNSSPKKK